MKNVLMNLEMREKMIRRTDYGGLEIKGDIYYEIGPELVTIMGDVIDGARETAGYAEARQFIQDCAACAMGDNKCTNVAGEIKTYLGQKEVEVKGDFLLATIEPGLTSLIRAIFESVKVMLVNEKAREFINICVESATA